MVPDQWKVVLDGFMVVKHVIERNTLQDTEWFIGGEDNFNSQVWF